MNETDLMNLIQVELSKEGYQVFRYNVGKFFTADGRPVSIGVKGFSDLFGFRSDGQIFFIEVKKKPNKPTEKQVWFLEKMRSKGALGGVAYSVEEAFEIVRGIRRN